MFVVCQSKDLFCIFLCSCMFVLIFFYASIFVFLSRLCALFVKVKICFVISHDIELCLCCVCVC